MRVLVIDDNRDMADITCRLLTRFDYDCRFETIGILGIELAFTWEADVVLLDVIMPDMDGIAVLKQLRARGYTGKIIMLSGIDSTSFVNQAREHGANYYLVKASKDLEGEIRSILSKIRKSLD